MRSVLRRQASERESLLRILQDPTFSDLVEAAAMMASEERWYRQRCLSDKHQCLDLSGAGVVNQSLAVVKIEMPFVLFRCCLFLLYQEWISISTIFVFHPFLQKIFKMFGNMILVKNSF